MRGFFICHTSKFFQHLENHCHNTVVYLSVSKRIGMNKTVKKALYTSVIVLSILIVILGSHIYIVTRHKSPDSKTIVMARINFRQQITAADAERISGWLYQQKGVSHVLCNPVSRIAVFTYYPVQANADRITKDLGSALHYSAVRYIPSADELKNGCPVATTSFTYRVYNFFKSII